MRCNHIHDHEVETEEDKIALVYGETIILSTISFIGYDSDRSGCVVLSEIDHDAINIVQQHNTDNLQIMIFNNNSISETIDKIHIYENSTPIDLKNIQINKCYQFSTTELKKKDVSTDGMIRNPITGKWSFL